MSAAEQPEYYLLWKGRQTGPFSLAAIREKLASGEINRMQQVGSNGRWTVLGDFLKKADGDSVEARRRAEEAQRQVEAAQREEQMRHEYEAQLATERAQQSALQDRLAEAEKRSLLSPPLPEMQPGFPPPPVYVPAADYPPPPGYAMPGYAPSGYVDPYAVSYPPQGPTRTSGLAVAAFVLSLCNFIPYVALVSSILVIIFGHVALSRIKRDPTLGGRGLALTGLIITYVLLALGFIAGLVYGLVVGHALHL